MNDVVCDRCHVSSHEGALCSQLSLLRFDENDHVYVDTGCDLCSDCLGAYLKVKAKVNVILREFWNEKEVTNGTITKVQG